MDLPAPSALGAWADADVLRVLAHALSLVGTGAGGASALGVGSVGSPGFVSARALAVAQASGGASLDPQTFLFRCQDEPWMWRVSVNGLQQYFAASGPAPPDAEGLAFYLAGALAHRMRNHAGELLVVSDEGDESLSEQGAGLLDTLADMSFRGWATRKVVVRKLVQGVRTLEDGSLKFLRR